MRSAATWRGIGLLVCFWYGASIVAIVTAKHILNVLPCPSSLTALQFAAATMATALFSGQSGMPPMTRSERNTVAAIAASYAAGFLLTNTSIAFAAPSFVETIKSAEPLSTVGLAAIFLREREGLSALLFLLPIILGVAMASGFGGSSHFSRIGLVLSLASNVSFSGRAVLTSHLRSSFPNAVASRSDVVLFHHVSRLGLALAVPVALLTDAWAVLDAGSRGGGGSGKEDLGAPSPGTPWLLALVLLNGTMHATYNGVSFMVLRRVSVTTHAVLNIVRRVVLIGVTALLFGAQLSAVNAAGVALCVVGCMGFAASKTKGRDASQMPMGNGAPLLPLSAQHFAGPGSNDLEEEGGRKRSMDGGHGAKGM